MLIKKNYVCKVETETCVNFSGLNKYSSNNKLIREKRFIPGAIKEYLDSTLNEFSISSFKTNELV